MQNYTVGDQDLMRKEFFGALIPFFDPLGRIQVAYTRLRVCVHGVCVCVFTAVCVHLDGLNAEQEF